MLTILLIRSGRTEYDCQGRIQGTLDVPLSEDGRREVDRRRRPSCSTSTPSIAALYAGPCRSAQETAEILGRAAEAEAQDARQAAQPQPGPVAGHAVRRSEVEAAQGLPPVAGTARDGLPARRRDAAGGPRAAARRRSPSSPRSTRPGTIALVLGQPLAERAAVHAARRASRRASATAKCAKAPLWEPLDVPADRSCARHAEVIRGSGRMLAAGLTRPTSA